VNIIAQKHNLMIRIAIDAMGGDFGPEPILEGVIQALDMKQFMPILVGKKSEILSLLPQYYIDKVEIVNAEDVIDMADSATDALKRKDSSIYKAVELVREGKADAVLSAGHSGATMTAATLRLGRLPGINKPGLATLMPNITEEKTLVLDVGSVTDCKPINLFQFGVMGEAYAEKILGVSSPKVGLLSNGSEDSKGNELTKATFPLLKGLKGFIGNVEGKDIFNGKVNVVVCDGFTGNILLKTSEGVVSTVFDLMKLYIRKSLPAKIGALMMKKKVFTHMKKQVDKDEYGGAPLLGLKGCAIISHGASSSKAIMNAVFQAINYVEKDVNSAIETILTESTQESQ
jgi:glycerol-3-phosphate acyltransferase PlsX